MHIIWIGYLFVALMISITQANLTRIVIYLVFLCVLPTIFLGWILRTRRRNQIAKQVRKKK